VSKDTTGTLAYGSSHQTYGGFVPMPEDLQPLVGVVLGPPGTQRLQRSYSGVMPSAGVQYQIKPEMMAYFSYNKGYKAGGINGQNGLGVPTDIEYGPEHVDAYEAGIKSKWFGDSVLANLDVFRSNYSGLQVPAIHCHPVTNICTNEVSNAGKSISQGVELEAQWVINENFRFTANITYLESYYVSYHNAPPTTLQMFCGGANGGSYVLPYCARFPNPVPAIADLSGFPTLYAPRWSGALRATYTTLFAGGQRFTADVSPFFTSSYNPDPDGLFPSLGDYVRLDARLAFETADGHWAFAVIGKNLADRVIATTLNYKEEPRNVAAQFRYKW
jgi:outer membrane receptor protein involved in Fe transport